MLDGSSNMNDVKYFDRRATNLWAERSIALAETCLSFIWYEKCQPISARALNRRHSFFIMVASQNIFVPIVQISLRTMHKVEFMGVKDLLRLCLVCYCCMTPSLLIRRPFSLIFLNFRVFRTPPLFRIAGCPSLPPNLNFRGFSDSPASDICKIFLQAFPTLF